MPIAHHRRAAPCSHCGDVVLIAAKTGRKGYGFGFMRRVDAKPKLSLEHADPGPDGEMFDAVDEGCRRPRVG